MYYKINILTYISYTEVYACVNVMTYIVYIYIYSVWYTSFDKHIKCIYFYK